MEFLVALTLMVAGQVTVIQLPATSLQTRWLDPLTPSCQVYDARMKQMNADLEEIDFVLKRLANKTRLSRAERRELEQAIKRQTVIERESRDQSLQVDFTAEWPKDFDPAWILSHQYRLRVQSPSIDWNGDSYFDPKGVTVESDAKQLKIRHEVLLGDYCHKPHLIQVVLEQNQ